MKSLIFLRYFLYDGVRLSSMSQLLLVLVFGRVFCRNPPENVADLGEDVGVGNKFLAVVDEKNVDRGVLDKVFLMAIGLADAALHQVALHRSLEHLLWDRDHYPRESLVVAGAAETE